MRQIKNYWQFGRIECNHTVINKYECTKPYNPKVDIVRLTKKIELQLYAAYKKMCFKFKGTNWLKVKKIEKVYHPNRNIRGLEWLYQTK